MVLDSHVFPTAISWFLLGFVPLIIMTLLSMRFPIPLVLPGEDISIEEERLRRNRYHVWLFRIAMIPFALCFAIGSLIVFADAILFGEVFAFSWLALAAWSFLPQDMTNPIDVLLSDLDGMGDNYEKIQKELEMFFIDFDETEKRVRLLRYLMEQDGVIRSVAINLFELYGG